jgi:hypothetical protein
MSDNPEGTIRRKVWFSETLALGLGASLLTWGEPDEDGFYTPALTLAATPAPLDVKRLARALHAVEPYAGENNCEVNYHADDAAAIAAAYAEEPT